ncbi:hypothetical protein N9E81_00350 [Algibacter sp.]|nr:hypothetical protein [Algibacter sp.]
MESIETLLTYSNLINKLKLESIKIHYIIGFENEYFEEEYLDSNCPNFQSVIINAESKIINLIIQNFHKAIKTQCGNPNVDLSKHDKSKYWKYSFSHKSKDGPLSKRYIINELIPQDEREFKELWLRHFIKIISKIVANITEVTGIEIKENLSHFKNDYSDKYWFKIGLLFATGEMDDLLKANDRNATKIAKELGEANLRPYISDSIGQNLNSDKNIFGSREKMSNIINYCKENKISIIPGFIKRLPSE